MRSAEAAAVLSTDYESYAESASIGYVVSSRTQRVSAWFQGAGLHTFEVVGLSPHAVWLDGVHSLGRKGASAQGAGMLWIDAAGERIGPLAVELVEESRSAWLGGRGAASERVAMLRGPLTQLQALLAFTLELVARGIAAVPNAPATNLESISERSMIVELLEQFARERIPGFVNTAAGRVSTRILSVDEARDALTWEGEAADFQLPACVEFPYLHAIYEVPLAAVRAQGNQSALPEWVTKSVRRTFRRVRAPDPLTLSFDHPHAPGLHVCTGLRDVSRTGLSFETDVIEHLLYPGLVLPLCELTLPGAAVAQCRAVVRSMRMVEGSVAVVGMSIEPLGDEHAEALRVVVEPALYPSTHTAAADVWELHESSGYLNLSGKQPSDFDRLKLHFMHAAHKLEAAPDLATVAYWPAQGRIEATVSHFRVYQSSWLACQLSKLKTPDARSGSRTGIRDMYMRIYESAQADADTRWLLTYVQDAAPRWSREIQITVAQRYVSTGEGCLVPFRALESDVSAPEMRNLRADFRVAPADPVSARAAMRDLHRVRPAQYLDALDLTEGRADLSEASARWHAAGLERQRQLFIAYEGSVRMALAVVEVAELGVHIYGLLDCLRMYPLRPGGERAFGALLREAHAWFGQRGRQKFVYLEEFPNSLPVLDLGFRNLGAATLSMLSIDRVPELLLRASDLASRPPPPHSRAHLREVHA